MLEHYVLVVDDDEGIREIATTALQDAGIAAVAVPDAVIALQVVTHRPPALILLAPANVPMSAAEFVQAYRHLPGPHCPVILFSARNEPEREAAAIGADGVIAKPFDLETLVTRVRQYMGRP